MAVVLGVLPTHTEAAQVARAESNTRQRREEQAFDALWAPPPGFPDAAWFETVVQPRLPAFTLPTIAKATGVSTSAASKWRAGRTVPHRRHWKALALLVGVDVPR
jgi:hypothetical protein